MFEKIKEFIAKHPYLTGGLVLLILLYFLLRNRGGGSQVSNNPGGVSDAVYTAQIAASAQQSQTDAALTAQNQQLNAQLAAAGLAAQLQQQQTATAADVANKQTTAAQETTDAQTAAAVAISNATTGAQLQLGEAQIGGAIQVAGIQAAAANLATSTQGAVDMASIQAQLQGLESTNATQEAIAQIVTGGQVTINGQNTAAAVTINGQNTQRDITVNGQNNDTLQILGQYDMQTKLGLGSDAVQINQSNNDVANNYINTAGGIDLAQIIAQFTLGQGQQTLQGQALNDTYSLEQGGQLNKGGEGGLNQLSAWLGVLGSPAATTAAAGAGGVGVAQNSGGNTPGGILSALPGFNFSFPSASAPGAPAGSVSSTISYPGISSLGSLASAIFA